MPVWTPGGYLKLPVAVTIRRPGLGARVDDGRVVEDYRLLMRMRRQTLLPSVLAMTFVTLLALPITAAAASGLPATITMQPAAAGPGAQVELVGIDFPSGQGVDLQLTTVAGSVHLATATTEAGGYFRQKVTLPADVAPGYWELRATGTTGTVAVHIFEAGPAVLAVGAAGPAETAVPATPSGNTSGANLLVLLVLFAVIGGIGGAAAYMYYQVHRPTGDPGMATGADPIWAGASSDS